MDYKDRNITECLLVVGIGAIVGGILVALTTKALPKIASRMMAGMMGEMMATMGEQGCSPAEI